MDSDTVMAYYRQTDSQKILVAANFGEDPVSLTLEAPVAEILLSNQGRTDLPKGDLTLESCEVIVVLV